MAVTYGFYNSLNADRRYNAEQMSAIFDGVITDGVFASIGGALNTVVGEGMQVLVKSGKAWFNSTWTLNDASLALAIDTADVSLTRIDAVVLEVNSGINVRENSIKIVKGTPSANPAKPTMESSEDVHQYALAYVTVAANVTSITAANIEINVGKTTCPYVTSVLQQTDITDLFNQWDAEFNTWFSNVQSQLSGDVATNLQRQIDELKINSFPKASSKEVYDTFTDEKVVTPAGLEGTIPKVGDVRFSTRDSLGDNWLLANGTAFDVDIYNALYKLQYNENDFYTKNLVLATYPSEKTCGLIHCGELWFLWPYCNQGSGISWTIPKAHIYIGSSPNTCALVPITTGNTYWNLSRLFYVNNKYLFIGVDTSGSSTWCIFEYVPTTNSISIRGYLTGFGLNHTYGVKCIAYIDSTYYIGAMLGSYAGLLYSTSETLDTDSWQIFSEKLGADSSTSTTSITNSIRYRSVFDIVKVGSKYVCILLGQYNSSYGQVCKLIIGNSMDDFKTNIISNSNNTHNQSILSGSYSTADGAVITGCFVSGSHLIIAGFVRTGSSEMQRFITSIDLSGSTPSKNDIYIDDSSVTYTDNVVYFIESDIGNHYMVFDKKWSLYNPNTDSFDYIADFSYSIDASNNSIKLYTTSMSNGPGYVENKIFTRSVCNINDGCVIYNNASNYTPLITPPSGTRAFIKAKEAG